MSYNRSLLAFDDVRAAFDRALQAPKGIRIPCRTRGEAVNLRSRFNYFRTLDREENKRNYDPDNFMWNRSAYDKLVLHIPPKGHKDANVLFIRPTSIDDLNIEEIE